MKLMIIPHYYEGPGGVPGKLPYMGAKVWPWRNMRWSCNAYDMHIYATFYCESCGRHKTDDTYWLREVPGGSFIMKRVVFGCKECKEPQFGFSGFNNGNWQLWGRDDAPC